MSLTNSCKDNMEDFALISALYRASIDGRRFMYEAVMSEDGHYEMPSAFTNRAAEILQVYLKSLGVRMQTIVSEDEFIGEPEHSTEVVGFPIKNHIIFCTPNEMYYLKKLSKLYKKYMERKESTIDDFEEAWEWIVENLTFKKKFLTDNIIKLFKNNIEVFC